MLVHFDKPIRRRIYEAFLKFDKDFLPPLLEILHAVDVNDAKDQDLRPVILDIFRKRGDTRCIPYLWHMSFSTKYPKEVRDQARETLSYFLQIEKVPLLDAKMSLKQMAEKCYQHKLKVVPGGNPIWKWDGHGIPLQPEYMMCREAEEFFGLRYAREALDLDPAYKPAQEVLLNLVLERTFDRSVDSFFLKPMPDEFRQLLSSIDSDILITVLERALDEHNIPVVLPAMEILGQRGELRAALPSESQPSRGITRALFYPNRRVQFAAVSAMMRLPYRPVPVGSQRIVELLRRFLTAEPISRSMVAMCPENDRSRIRKIFKKAGFDDLELRTQTLDETFSRLSKSNDYDIIFVHPSVPVSMMPYVLTQLRRDQDLGRLPLIVFSKLENQAKLFKLCDRYPNTYVELDTFLEFPENAIVKYQLAEEVAVEIQGKPATLFDLKAGMDLLLRFGDPENDKINAKIVGIRGRSELEEER